MYTAGQKIKKSPGKKTREIKINQFFFREIAFQAVLKWQKMEFGQKKIS